jgi:hypothetical protein
LFHIFLFDEQESLSERIKRKDSTRELFG